MITAASGRPGLIEASDEFIDRVVTYADPMVLSALLYQLTGDNAVFDMKIGAFPGRLGDVPGLAMQTDVESVQRKAAGFLKRYRDQGAPPLAIGPADRLAKSVRLATEPDIPDSELKLWIEELALDPFARGLDWEQTPSDARLSEFSVIVIGAGMGGLNAAVQLKHAGIPFIVIEKNSGVGGTWYENRYPGARVDTPSRAYTHIYGVDFGYPNPFCERDENQKYFNWVADHFDLRGTIILDTEVTSASWDEDSSTWQIEAESSSGRTAFHANAIISAVGFLSRPNTPHIQGMETFTGPAFHTARWPDNLDLTGKRVAVIGTGATGYQLIPELARLAGHVDVFQRTPQWVFNTPGYLDPFPPEIRWLDQNLPYYTNFMRLRTAWLAGPRFHGAATAIDPDWNDPFTRSALNQKMRDSCLAFINAKLGDRPDLVSKMIPPHPVYSARPIVQDEKYGIYDALLRDNVTLTTERIREITVDAVVTEDDQTHPVDVIVYATGFYADKFLWPMEVRGLNGSTPQELWAKDGPRAYLGVLLPGFPNFFIIYGPNMNPFGGGLGLVNHEEMTTRYALECLQVLINQHKASIDVDVDAYRRFNEELDRREKLRMYSDPRNHSYYTNAAYGRSSANSPFPGNEMWRMLLKPELGDLILR